MRGHTVLRNPKALRPSLMVALAGGIGMTWGPIFASVLYKHASESTWVIFSLLVATALVAFLAWRYVEPFMARTFGLKIDHPHGPPIESKAFLRAFAAIFVTGLILEPIAEHFTTRPERWWTSLESVILGAAVTYGWARGALRTRRFVAIFGMAFGVAANVPFMLIVPFTYPANYVPLVIVLMLVGGIGYGAFGGLLLDYVPQLPVWLRVGLGIVASMLLFWAVRAGLGTMSFAAVLGGIFTSIGWTLAIVIFPGGQLVLTPLRERTALAPMPTEPAIAR